ncbi:MAG: DNA primase [Dehalococcoidia bacterium]
MDVVEAIKREIDPVEYIGRITPLQKSGRSFKGLCPFHTEKTPSFYVFPDRGTWRCFGSCGEGGDIFTFVQKRENSDFRAALRTLAAEAGIELSAEDSRKRTHNERLAATMSAAVDYYQRCLREPGGEAAMAYLTEKRGIEQRTIDTWRLGWAPEGWRGLRDFLRNRGYEDNDMIGAGLLIEGENGREGYDRFRGRVIIPIANERGEFIAMGGRGLQGEEPKYLNSPQTDLFDKGRTLFGLNIAAPAIREQGTAIVVEGYMDVLGPWQAGFPNVVATMGTSLTENHAALLKRFAKRIVLAMDPDAAGLAAAERAGDLFLGMQSAEGMGQSARTADAITTANQVDLRVAPLPAGKDPDEVAREAPEVWRAAIENAPTFPEFLLRRVMDSETIESPMQARATVDRLRPVLLAVSDPVERAMYVQRVARHLGISEEAIIERLRAGLPARPGVMARRPEQQASLLPEDVLLALLLRHPGLRQYFKNYPLTLFTGALERELFSRWLHNGAFFLEDGDDDPVVLRARSLEQKRLPPLTAQEAGRAAQDKVREILRDRIVLHQAARAEELAQAEKTFGANRVAELALATWRGGMPEEDERALAESVIEELQLGLSIHRREGPGAA